MEKNNSAFGPNAGVFIFYFLSSVQCKCDQCVFQFSSKVMWWKLSMTKSNKLNHWLGQLWKHVFIILWKNIKGTLILWYRIMKSCKSLNHRNYAGIALGALQWHVALGALQWHVALGALCWWNPCVKTARCICWILQAAFFPLGMVLEICICVIWPRRGSKLWCL